MPKIGVLAQQAADRLWSVNQRLGIAGPVGEKHAVGLQRQHFLRGGRAGQDRSPGNPCRTDAGRCSISARSPAPPRAAASSARGHSTGGSVGPADAAARPIDGPSGITSRTRSRPTRPGLALALATRLASSRSVGGKHALHGPSDAHAADQGPRVDPFHGRQCRSGCR